MSANRATQLSVTDYHNLNHACRLLTAAGFKTYLVGSALERPDYRDVDLRTILDDAVFDTMIGVRDGPRHRLLNTALSEWLAARTGLPIDFQFQREKEANIEFPGNRNFIGVPIQ